MEEASLSLLPKGFDKHNPDCMILSVALKYKNDNTILLTSDNMLQSRASGLGITTIFSCEPKAYPPTSPFARTTLWHGTSGANEFLCSALPTARGLLQPTFIVILSICGKNSTIYLTDMGPAERCSLPDMHCISREKQSVKLLPELQACLLL